MNSTPCRSHPIRAVTRCFGCFTRPLPEQGIGEAAFDILPEVVRLSRVQNARFFGYVLGSGEPVGAVGDLLASVINQNVTAWRSGPAAVTIERTVVEWLSQAVGCPGFRGYLTGGGSSANLMGLAMAREAKMPGNEKGVTSGGVVYASTEVHMSIPKSVALLGIGRDNMRLIPVDASFRMIPEELERQIAAGSKRREGSDGDRGFGRNSEYGIHRSSRADRGNCRALRSVVPH